jgi:hypothetical protein
VSADLPGAEAQRAASTVEVQVVFHAVDDRQAQAVAAKMVDRAYEIANLPECECDVDVSVQHTPSDALASVVEYGDAPTKL